MLVTLGLADATDDAELLGDGAMGGVVAAGEFVAATLGTRVDNGIGGATDDPPPPEHPTAIDPTMIDTNCNVARRMIDPPRRTMRSLRRRKKRTNR